jgi:GntR family transcriptional regulator/MocR family aminotransferase
MTTMPRAGLTPYISFDRTCGVPFYTQIYNGYRTAIVSGRLGPGQRLPSTRTVAAELRISRLPVLNAFDQLLHEGYLEGKVGSGTYVRDCIPDEVARPMRLRRPTPSRVRPAMLAPDIDGTLCVEGSGTFRSLPALDRFPNGTFARLIRRHATHLPADLLAGGDPAGYLPLREAIADYLRIARDVDCDAGQVVILSGSQMGLRVAAMALTTSESAVCMEDPGYRGARSALAVSAAMVIPIAVDGEGIDVPAIARLGPRAKLAYVTPSHHYPLGASMAVSRRLELLSWADHNNSWILEDDYDCEFRYSSRPMGALQGMDTRGRVIYLGTFSTVLFPALRLGYAVVPRDVVHRFVGMRETLDLFSPSLYQLVLTDFLREGHFARHLRRMRAIYLARRDALIAAIHEYAADVLLVGNTDAGLHLVTFLPEGVDDQEVVRQAAQRGLFPMALSTCYATSASRSGLIIGFGGSHERVLMSAIRILGGIIRSSFEGSRHA